MVKNRCSAYKEQGVIRMRAVFTEGDRGLLERWLENRAETGETRKLFTQFRRSGPLLRSDLRLMSRAIRELQEG